MTEDDPRRKIQCDHCGSLFSRDHLPKPDAHDVICPVCGKKTAIIEAYGAGIDEAKELTGDGSA